MMIDKTDEKANEPAADQSEEDEINRRECPWIIAWDSHWEDPPLEDAIDKDDTDE
jgi:hypothetical protein